MAVPVADSGTTLLDAEGEARLYHALSQEWLPVAYASQIDTAPVAVEVLGHELVLVRLGGELRAFADLCPHRGARLSLGWCADATLQCPYHGWRFAADGACVDIPSLPDARIPGRARLHRYPLTISAGLVWVFVGGSDTRPAVDPITCAEVGDPTYRLIEVPPYDWDCGVGRRIENFVDLAHLPWVHDEVLSSRADPLTPAHEVTRSGRVVHMRARLPEYQNPRTQLALDRVDPTLAGPGKEIVTDQQWRVEAPLGLWWRQTLPGGRHFGVLLVASPLGTQRCRTFTVLFRDFALDPGADEEILRFHLEVAEADRPVVESQRPHRLPVDLTAELHLRDIDRVSVEYRRALRELAGGAVLG